MDLAILYSQGLIPGPSETEEAFAERIKYAGQDHSFAGEYVSLETKAAAWKLTSQFYGMAPDWVSVCIANQGLAFWEAGAAWELEGNQTVIQLRKNTPSVSRTEVLAHEAVHAARRMFHESRFEELLAFRVSEKPWRRYLGPLIREGWEAKTFLGAALFDGVCSFCMGFFGLIPLLFLFFVSRLIYDQRVLSRCLARLPNFQMVLCFTDREIVAIAKGEDWKTLADGTLRWQMIKELFSEAP